MFDCTPVGLKSERSDFTELETPFFLQDLTKGKRVPTEREKQYRVCVCVGVL